MQHKFFEKVDCAMGVTNWNSNFKVPDFKVNILFLLNFLLKKKFDGTKTI